MKKKAIMLIFMLLLILFSLNVSSAVTTYPYVGGLDGNYEAGTGYFTEGFEDYTLHSRSISMYNPPFVYDLNNDGTNEIITVSQSNNRVSIFHFDVNSGITLVDYVSSGCSGNYSNIEIFDYDNDGSTEIIYACTIDETIKYVDFDGENVTVEKSISWNTGVHTTGSVLIGCREVERCLMVFPMSDTYSAGVMNLEMFTFNSTGYRDVSYIDRESSGLFCWPQILSIEYTDYDKDGTSEYIFSYSHVGSVLHSYNIRAVRVTDSMNAVGELSINITGWDTVGSGTCKGNNIHKYFSSVNVANYEGNSKEELVIAYMKDSDEYKMRMYDYQGSLADTFPSILDADGTLMSNVVTMKAFNDIDADKGFCVLGDDKPNDRLDLLCASPEHSGWLGVDNEEFFYDYSGESYEISDEYLINNIMIHSGNFLQSGSSVDEILVSYGMFYLDENFLGVSNDLEKIWSNPIGDDGAFLSIDYEKNGNADLMFLTNANLWYIDDGFVNRYGYIDTSNGFSRITPCLESVWKVNTSVGVTFQVTDLDNDNVCGYAVLYNGSVYNQTSVTQCGATGSVFTFTFTANVTGNNYILSLVGYDVMNNDTKHIMDYTFNVGVNGAEFGECYTTLVITPPIGSGASPSESSESGTSGETEALTNNSITTTVNNVNASLGIGTTLIWLFFMLIVAGGLVIIMQNSYMIHTDGKVTVMIISFTEVVLLIVGTILGFINAAIIWTLIILSVIIAGFFLGNKYFGSGNKS